MRQDHDQVYVDRVLQGEVNAFTLLVERHQDLVFGICLRLLNHREEAEEVAQDVFLNVYRSLEKFRGQAAFSTWIYRIAYNAAVSSLRRRKPEWTGMDDDTMERIADEWTDDLTDTSDVPDREEWLKAAVDTLPEADRLLLDLFYTRSLGMEQIGEILGLSLSNVKVRMHRIRKKLWTLLQDGNEKRWITFEERRNDDGPIG
ncbi:MAG TPA: sigma-70 family RNA polymerase sigma factor [Bacteroidales bacterium]|nr:sigma-70 family RNA polymerase sigma factor [Bacteroidales bacterium]HRZ77650.1 sigma-70 family RNA polymerase sigma factor [Bacteroidales bacterium]